MNYNFDEIINRNGTDSVKWDAVERRCGRSHYGYRDVPHAASLGA